MWMDGSSVGTTVSQAQSAIPPKFYRDNAVVTQEVDRIFRKHWICLGRADRVGDPGSFAAVDVAGQSLILARDKAGVLHAFANTCRHRGARLADGEGKCNGFACPFHAWNYRLDGSLRAAPQMADVVDFRKEDHGLITYRAEERCGFIFVCLNPEAGSIDDHLGDFAALHTPWPLESLVTIRRREFEAPCNWKAFLDVFNEYYHLPCIHPTSINSLYQPPGARDDAAGNIATQFGPTSGTGALLEDQQEHSLPSMPGLEPPHRDGVRYSWVFPNMTFAAGRDALWMYEAYPKVGSASSAESCHVVQTICFPPETAALPNFETHAAAYIERLDAALAEDFPALENQMKGLRCQDADGGVLHSHLEASVAAFSAWYQGEMAD
jgi:phenylpropionate dioxygenase-like ring-hydroxylating dioxygenase large terminal subunit